MASPAVNDLLDALEGLRLGGVRFYKALPSTNDTAREWANEGAPDFSLVLAEKQTRGRGRNGRRWFSTPRAALTFSLILRPRRSETLSPALFAGLGAVALVKALRHCCALDARIKWPNDILLDGRKAAGILVETAWTGAQMDFVIVGIGINVRKESVPSHVEFPAVSVEDIYGSPPPRAALLRGVLDSIREWRNRLGTGAVLRVWEENLAFRGTKAEVHAAGETARGILLGLEADGSLRLRDEEGRLRIFRFGETHLRPVR